MKALIDSRDMEESVGKHFLEETFVMNEGDGIVDELHIWTRGLRT